MTVTILDAAALAAANAAADQVAQRAALLSAGDVTARYYAGATLVQSETHGPAEPDNLVPRGFTLGAPLASTVHVSGATITHAIFRTAAGVDQYRIEAAELGLTTLVTQTGRRINISDAVLPKLRVVAAASLPVGTESVRSVTWSVADAGFVDSGALGSIQNTGNVAQAWSIPPLANITVNPSSGTLAAGVTQALTVTASTAGTFNLTLVASGAAITGNTQTFVASVGAVSSTMAFSEIPEIVFVSGFAGQTEHLGVFHLDHANRWTPGDLLNTSNWTPDIPTQLVGEAGAALPTGLSYNSATGVLSYDGSDGTAATRSVNVRLRVTSTQAESEIFRIRILQPTVIWGTGATTDATIAANFAAVPKADPVDGGVSGFRGATRSRLSTAATDAAPNVILVMPGSYQAITDLDGVGFNNGSLYLAENMKHMYVIGLPGSRPVITGNAITASWSFQSTRVVYVKNFELVDFRLGEGSFTDAEKDLADRRSYITQVKTRDLTTYENWYGAPVREGNAAWAWVKSRVETWFWGVEAINSGGIDSTHVLYVEGRSNSGMYLNNCRFLGGRRQNQCKSTRWEKKIRNSYLTCFLDPTNPSVGQRTQELIDWVAVGIGVIYNNHFFSGYTAELGGTQAGLVRKRLRRDWWGSDTPAYPDVSFSPLTTSLVDGGYSSPPGFSPGAETFVSPSYWAAVSAKPIGDPTNPYTFPYYVSYNTFQWHEEGSGRRPWFRDDGTYPMTATTQFAEPVVLGTAPAGWVERSANFFANNTLIGWQAADVTNPAKYINLSESATPNRNPSVIPTASAYAVFDTATGKWVNGPGPWLETQPARGMHYNAGLVVPWDTSSAFVPLPEWFSVAERRKQLPDWVNSLSVGQWGRVPLATSWSDVDPEADPTVNPNGVAAAPWRGSNGLLSHILAWCGGATDGAGVWSNVIGAGHTNGGDNAAYKLDLNSEAPEFVRLSNPSGSLPGAIVINDGQEATGLHSDGRARAGHNYSTVHWNALRQKWVWTTQRGSYSSGAGGGNFPVLVDPVTGAHTCRTALVSPIPGQARYASTYDPRRDRTYMKSTGSSPVYSLNLDGTNTMTAWTTLGSTLNVSGYMVMTYIPGATAAQDMLLFWSTATGWQVMDITTGIWYSVTMTGTPAWNEATIGYMQPAWEPTLKVLLCWNNAANTTQITRITPGANPYGDPWVIDTIPVAGSNAVTPSAAAANGTYGRFFLWPKAKLAVIVNGVEATDVFSFKYA